MESFLSCNNKDLELELHSNELILKGFPSIKNNKIK